MAPGPVVDRFIGKTQLASSGCLEWTGYLDEYGYGTFWLAGKSVKAHRVAYILFAGDTGDALVLHLCHNRRCVNPMHLVLGDQQENQRQRRTCDCGECRTCRHRERMRAWSRAHPGYYGAESRRSRRALRS